MADDIAVERARFNMGGTTPGSSDGQPWIMAAIGTVSKSGKDALESHMDMETMVVQRLRDL
jgi:hypothetical protein